MHPPLYILQKRFFLILLAFFLFNSTTAQRAFIATPEIRELTGGPGNCSNVLITNQCGSTAEAYNLAVYNDTIYYTNGIGDLFSFKIGVPASCKAYPVNLATNCLTAGPDGLLYFIGTGLQRYNPHTNYMEYLGSIPSTFSSAGDLFFYNGKLLLAGIPEGIYEINIDNPSASTLYMSTGNLYFFSLISYPVPCGNSRFFGLYTTAYANTMYELDLVNKVVIGPTCSLPFFVYDGGSSTENGVDEGIHVTDISTSQSCTHGTIHIQAFIPGTAITYILDNNISNTTGVFDNISPGSHHISMMAGNCSLDTTIVLTQAPGPLINSIQKNEPTGCNESNGSIIINASSASMPITYTLQTTGTQQSNGAFTNLSTGLYHFLIENADGCITDTTITLSYTASITPVFTTINITDPTCSNELIGSISVSVDGEQGPYSIFINNNVYANNQLITGLGEGLYNIVILNEHGCIADTTSRKLILRYEPSCTEECINTRNAFTPNGDGVNDLWYVYDGYSCLSNVTVAVFNRYGSKVFESSDYKNTWDGHYNNKQLPDGTYYAVIEYKLLTGRNITVRTDLTILR